MNNDSDKELRISPKKFSERVIREFKDAFVFYVFIFLAVGLMSSFLNAAFVLFMFFIFHLIEYRRWCKYYITGIFKSGEYLTIEYLEKDNLKKLKDRRDQFSIVKKKVWYKIRGNVKYVEFSYQGKVILRQFSAYDIDEVVLNNVVDNY